MLTTTMNNNHNNNNITPRTTTLPPPTILPPSPLTTSSWTATQFLRDSRLQHSPHTRGHHERVCSNVADGEELLRCRDNSYLKFANASFLSAHVGVIAEALHTFLSRKQLHSQAGKHEHEEKQQHQSQEELLETKGKLEQDVAHAGHQADET